MTDGSIDNLLRKVAALLNKTVERGATPEEAASAAAKATELLTKYNLEMSDVERTRSKTEKPEKPGKFTYDTGIDKQNWRWAVQVFGSVAQFNYCHGIQSGMRNGYYQQMVFIGKEHNVKVAEYIFRYLYNEVVRIRDIAWNQYGKYAGENRKTWMRHFGWGAAEAIYNILEAEQSKQRYQDNNVRALVVVSDAEIKRAVQEYFPVLNPSRQKGAREYTNGLDSGYTEGSKIQIKAGISGSTQEPLKRLA